MNLTEMLQPLMPLGHVEVPSPLSGDLTARFQAADWPQLSAYWRIIMCPVLPNSDESVEMAGNSLTIREEEYVAHAMDTQSE